MAYYIVEVWTAQEPAKKAHFLSPTVREARKAYAEKHGYDVTDVMGRRLGLSEATVAFGFETEEDAQAWMDENL